MYKAILSALLVALPIAASAASPEDVAKARQGFYSLLGLEMDGLVAMVKGEAEYDPEKAAGHAADMLTLTRYSMGDLYAPGTSKADLPGETRALPAIWEDAEGAREKGMAFVEAVTALNEAADQGKGELAKAVQDLGATCKGCHDEYRAKDF